MMTQLFLLNSFIACGQDFASGNKNSPSRVCILKSLRH